MVSRAALHHPDGLNLLQDGGERLETGPSAWLPGQLAGQDREEGDDDGQGEDPPAGGEQSGGVSQRPVDRSPEAAGDQEPGGVPDRDHVMVVVLAPVLGGHSAEQEEEETGQQVEQEEQSPDSQREGGEPPQG